AGRVYLTSELSRTGFGCNETATAWLRKRLRHEFRSRLWQGCRHSIQNNYRASSDQKVRIMSDRSDRAGEPSVWMVRLGFYRTVWRNARSRKRMRWNRNWTRSRAKVWPNGSPDGGRWTTVMPYKKRSHSRISTQRSDL